MWSNIITNRHLLTHLSAIWSVPAPGPRRSPPSCTPWSQWSHDCPDCWICRQHRTHQIWIKLMMPSLCCSVIKLTSASVSPQTCTAEWTSSASEAPGYCQSSPSCQCSAKLQFCHFPYSSFVARCSLKTYLGKLIINIEVLLTRFAQPLWVCNEKY